METEIEAKFTDIDPTAIRQKLKDVGAQLVHEERLMKRKNFDYPDRRLDKISGWIRVRDEGDKITLSYKQLHDRTLHGTKEINLVVDDFDKACEFFINIGLELKSSQESKREKWTLDKTEVTIDTWPWIPTFLEIEGTDEPSVRTAANQLDLNWQDALHGSVEIVYQQHYNFTENEIDAWKEITFSPVPDWLAAKAKP